MRPTPKPWKTMVQAGPYRFDPKTLIAAWPRLHQGDCESMPTDPAVLQAWVHFHNGQFEAAVAAGLQAGGAGITAANKATSIYATFLETSEKARLDLFQQVAQRAELQQASEPRNANAWYWQAYALAHYSQGISVAKGLAQGLGKKLKQALEHAITHEPRHADAHLGLAMFHAEVIDKVGAMIGGMTYGARKEVGLSLFKQAHKLNPDSALTLIRYANGLLMLEGDKAMDEATRLYEKAARCQPMDATEQLEVEMAMAELAE